ncbi:AT-rich interactive domain-containing protein 6-like [Solanum stenotomum]|uniref:AT-rich interactive domain-containing protein 6-like n=1 Tax=Solanum stenotomum TaxID=172797 RepID=UPI0020D11824|nr:AT-rich interactive domain-containing protein 6-like [Solanum stenotomum]
MKANKTTVTTDGGARSYEFQKVKLEVTDSLNGKTPEPACSMFSINPSTANAGQHSGEVSESISAMMADGKDDEGFLEDQDAFLGELGTFYLEKAMEFKPPRFYGHQLNCLKLWRSVIRLGGYDRGSGYQICASGRAVRDSAARCKLGWQEQHLLGYGEVAEPIVKERSAYNTPKRTKSLKTSGSLKHEGQNEVEHPMKAVEIETSKQLDVQVVHVGPPADWVKINVREQNDSFEVYALVPGLLRDEVRVQSDPAGLLFITGQPNQLDNLWGVTCFKKVVTLPARIDQLRTNVVVSLHGCLHVHVPFAHRNL